MWKNTGDFWRESTYNVLIGESPVNQHRSEFTVPFCVSPPLSANSFTHRATAIIYRTRAALLSSANSDRRGRRGGRISRPRTRSTLESQSGESWSRSFCFTCWKATFKVCTCIYVLRSRALCARSSLYIRGIRQTRQHCAPLRVTQSVLFFFIISSYHYNDLSI